MSRTLPLAVRRSGGIRAEEPTGAGISEGLAPAGASRRAVYVNILFFVRDERFYLAPGGWGEMVTYS